MAARARVLSRPRGWSHMMIGTSFRSPVSLRTWRRRLRSRPCAASRCRAGLTSGTWSCSSATASMPSRAGQHPHAVALEQPLGHARTVMEIVHHHRKGAPVAALLRRHRRLGPRALTPRAPGRRCQDDDDAPSPRMVAPDMPRIPEICGPTDLTTISRLPTSSSATRPVECSPARTKHHRKWSRPARQLETAA